ncbi:pilus assembly protein PilV [Candidatus Pelagibacter sp.]|nr:pilus assembly protein PilV [Candidatus Pelagibacter sp.]
MKKKYLKSIAGLTLVEILIGIVVSSLMMAAMYSTYTIVNNSYNQVVDKAKISRSSRDLVELLIRDIRMSGFKYYLGTNELGYPEQSYLEFVGGTTSIKENHDPIVIIANELGHNIDGTDPTVTKNNAGDLCCDKIHIVFDDFNQNDKLQPYKRYKLTYYALPVSDSDDSNPRYAVYKSKISWKQQRDSETASWPTEGDWVSDCTECYHEQLVKDYVEDMEFIALDQEGRKLSPDPSPSDYGARQNLYKIRSVDIRLAFRSENEFFRFEAREGNERQLSGFSRAIKKYSDRYLRDSVVVTVYTRNIIDDGIF